LSKAVLVPPVITPSEVPAGAFLFSAGLAARGMNAPIHDLSLGFFMWLFTQYSPRNGFPNCLPPIEYLRNPEGGLYDPQRHRSACGVLQSVLKRYSAGFPGWQLSLMDCSPPQGVHSVKGLRASASDGKSPFSHYFANWFSKEADSFKHGLISLSYISQLPAAVELALLLESNGKKVTVGGSLPAALNTTGDGVGVLKTLFPDLCLDDGRSIAGDSEPLLSKLVWPPFSGNSAYLSARPVVPYPLTTGCIWNQCLFCPDRSKPLFFLPRNNLGALLEKCTEKPVVHLIDSAVPSKTLREMLPLLSSGASGFYGFCRPETSFLSPGLLMDMSDAGCLMIQTGLESGSDAILSKFRKGFSPETAERVVRTAHDSGIRNYAYLLFGLPGETEADRMMTLEQMRRLKGSVDYINISVFNLPVKSELTDRAEEFGISQGEYDPDAEVLRFYSPFECHGGQNPRKAARRFLQEIFKPDPAVSEILLRTPRWFRAGHMAMMKRNTRA
jgi:hypothetical protein